MKTEYDVVVLGGGVAGVSAALSARREGKSVVILERNSLLGGLATCGLIHRYEPLCDGRGKQIIYSQAEELLKLSIKHGYKTLDENWLKGKKGKGRYATYFDPNLFALSLTRLIDNEGIKIFFESQIAEFKHKNGKVLAVDIYTIEGKIRIKGKVFIDATGSGYAGKMIGIPFKNGSNYLTYVTTTYKKGLKNPVLQRSGANLYGDNHPKGMKKFKEASQNDINEYLIAGQKLALEEFEKGIKEDLSILPNMVQFRKISMLKGEYTLLGKDKCKHFKDSIGAVGIFNEEGKRYEIPYRCLFNNKFKNLFFAGRNISSYGEARENTRVIPICILTGEVTGIMASILIDKSEIDLEYLQEKEINRGIKLHYT